MLKNTLVALVLCFGLGASAQELTQEDAAAALRKAVAFFRTEVSTEGGYLWRYSADLKFREGEGVANDTMIWVQPPGTPSVGEAYLAAHESTKDSYYLDAARETAHALVQGQLHSGGWTYQIHFSQLRRATIAYRTSPQLVKLENVSTLDDDTTQSALRFLMKVDRALGFKDEAIHEATIFGLDALVAVQYPNGAWPQRFDGPPDPAKYPVKAASYPESWLREYAARDYKHDYTFNDSALADTVETLFEAGDVYAQPRYTEAARKAGDFIVLAQMPDPQPAWAQQYDADMHPSWARKFEPPAVTGGESHSAIRTLIAIYRRTGDKKYLEPIPRALAYLRSSELPDGRLARFYELQTNKPLYFTKDYKLTYSSADMPTHYSFITGSWVAQAEAQYQEVLHAEMREKVTPVTPTMSPELAQQSRDIVKALDDRGAWVEEDRLRYHGDDNEVDRVLNAATFAQNVRTLSRYIAACD